MSSKAFTVRWGLVLLVAALLLLFGGASVQAEEETRTINLEEFHSLSIYPDGYKYEGESLQPFTGNYIITGQSRRTDIFIAVGKKVEFRDVSCGYVRFGSYSPTHLLLAGENQINAGMDVSVGTTVTIDSVENGSLTVKPSVSYTDGQYNMFVIALDGNLIVNSGRINVGTGVVAPIQVKYSPKWRHSGSLTVNGGEITAYGYADPRNSFIGCGYGDAGFGKITVNGGTINAGKRGTIGLSEYYQDDIEDCHCEDITINGGSIVGTINTKGRIINNAGEALSQLAVTLPDITQKTAVTSLSVGGDSSYGLKDVTTTEKGELFLWLPQAQLQDDTRVTLTTQDGKTYTGEIYNGVFEWIRDASEVGFRNQSVYENEPLPKMELDTSRLPQGATVEYSVNKTPDGPGKYRYIAAVTQNGQTLKYRATLTVLPLQEIGDVGLKDSEEVSFKLTGQKPTLDYSKVPAGCKVSFSPGKVKKTNTPTQVAVTISGRGYQTKTQTVTLTMKKYKSVIVSIFEGLLNPKKAAAENAALLTADASLPTAGEGQDEAAKLDDGSEAVTLKMNIQVQSMATGEGKGEEETEAVIPVPQGTVTILGQTYPLDENGDLDGCPRDTDGSYLITATREALKACGYKVETVYTPAEDTPYDTAAVSVDSDPSKLVRDAITLDYDVLQGDDDKNLSWKDTVQIKAAGGSKTEGEAYTYRLLQGDDFATLSQDGQLSFTKAGYVAVEVSLAGNADYNGASNTISFYVGKAYRETEFEAAPVTYDGELHRIELSGDLEPGTYVEYIEESEDTVGDFDYMATDAGAYHAAVYVAADDRYVGEITYSDWTITPRDIADVQISGVADRYSATGSPVTPVPEEVKVSDDLYLNPDDYDVRYENNTEAGTATLTLTGKGNFTGTVSKTFAITAQKGGSGESQSTGGGSTADQRKITGNTKTGIVSDQTSAALIGGGLLALCVALTAVLYKCKQS